MRGQRCTDRGRVYNFGVLQNDTIGPGKRLEHITRIEGRFAHRKPARAAIAQGTLRHRPSVYPTAIRVGVDRQIAIHDGHLGHRHVGPIPICPGIHRYAIPAACTTPLKMNPIEI